MHGTAQVIEKFDTLNGVSGNHYVNSVLADPAQGWPVFASNASQEIQRSGADVALIEYPWGIVTGHERSLHGYLGVQEELPGVLPHLFDDTAITCAMNTIKAASASGQAPWVRIGGFTATVLTDLHSNKLYKFLMRLERSIRPLVTAGCGLIIDDCGDKSVVSPEWALAIIARTWNSRVGYMNLPDASTPWGVHHNPYSVAYKKQMTCFVPATGPNAWQPVLNGVLQDTLVDCKDPVTECDDHFVIELPNALPLTDVTEWLGLGYSALISSERMVSENVVAETDLFGV